MRAVRNSSFVWAVVPLVFTLAISAPKVQFVTRPNATISSETIALAAEVTSIPPANQMEIRISNRRPETIRGVAQTISAREWSFGESLPALPVQVARSGTIIRLGFCGRQYGSRIRYDLGRPGGSSERSQPGIVSSQVVRGMEITALSGGSPDETVIGPPNSSSSTEYQCGGGLRGDNPFLQTVLGSYVSWRLDSNPTAGITANTVLQTSGSYSRGRATAPFFEEQLAGHYELRGLRAGATATWSISSLIVLLLIAATIVVLL